MKTHFAGPLESLHADGSSNARFQSQNWNWPWNHNQIYKTEQKIIHLPPSHKF